jgi:hypothetical protein
MALDANIRGSVTGNGAEVDANGRALVRLPDATTPSNVGGVRVFAENDGGELTGTPLLRSGEVSVDYRQRVGIDTVMFTETFNYSTQDTSNWSYTFSTLTVSQPGNGYLQFGTVQGTTSAHGAFMRTFQTFPLFGTSPLYIEGALGQFTAALVANEVFLYGLGLPTAATTRPTDGVWLRVTTGGVEGVLAYNGVETISAFNNLFPLSSLTVGTVYKFAIVVAEETVDFWIDDVLLGSITIPVAQHQPFLQGSLPLFAMKYNSGAVSNTNTMRITDITVSLADIATNKPWSHQLAVAGRMAYQGQPGNTVGSTQAIGAITTGSSAIPTSAAGSNTAANATGLGGTGAINAAAGGATDYIATSFQNPAGTINITARNLIITGVRISTINTGATVATTPTTLQWGIGYGHTAASMQTLETGSFVTGTTKTPRRVLLGFQSAAVGAVIGALYSPDIDVNFADAPIVVRPGEFINTFMKQIVGTATASQTITYIVMFRGYFE